MEAQNKDRHDTLRREIEELKSSDSSSSGNNIIPLRMSSLHQGQIIMRDVEERVSAVQKSVKSDLGKAVASLESSMSNEIQQSVRLRLRKQAHAQRKGVNSRSLGLEQDDRIIPCDENALSQIKKRGTAPVRVSSITTLGQQCIETIEFIVSLLIDALSLFWVYLRILGPRLSHCLIVFRHALALTL